MIKNISAIYSRALMNVIKNNNEYLLPLEKLAELFSKDKTIYQYFVDPRINISEKKDFLAEVMGHLNFSPIIIDFFSLIIDSGRALLIQDIILELNILGKLSSGVMNVKVFSPYALSNSIRVNLVNNLSKKLQKLLFVDYLLEPSMIGGIRIVYDNIEIDLSINNALEKIRKLPLYG